MAMYRNSCSYRGMYDRYTNADPILLVSIGRLSDSEMASLVFVVVCNRYGRNFRNSKRNIFDFQLSVD